MIKINDNKVSGAYIGKKLIRRIYSGAHLIFEFLKGCFTEGYWINDQGWMNDEGWKNN